MPRAKCLVAFVLFPKVHLIRVLLLILSAQCIFTHISAQSELKRPGNISDIAWARFQNMIRYDDPDSLVVYDVNDSQVPFEKRIFKYDNRHRVTYTDVYRMSNDGYRFKERELSAYDSITGKLAQREIQVMYKRMLDTFTTRTRKMERYDSNGNIITSVELERKDSGYFIAGGDSNAYQYNSFSAAYALSKYSYGILDKQWSLKNRYTGDSIDSKGDPKSITVFYGDNVKEPVYRYHHIKWAKLCTGLENIDTLANEYTMAYFQNGKWTDSLKYNSYTDKIGRVDSAITYVVEKDSLLPYKKDVYTYDGLTGYGSALHYIYYEGHWLLSSGKRRVISADNELYLKVITQEYIFNSAVNDGKWKDELKILGY